MMVYCNQQDGGVLLMTRAEGDGIIGDFCRFIGPGDSIFGRPCEWWRDLASGVAEVGEDGIAVEVEPEAE